MLFRSSLTYHDAYLANLVTDEREARALADVDAIGDFLPEWRERLAVARAYVIAATESQRAPEDLFGAKAERYRKEFTGMLPLARAASGATDDTGVGTIFSVPLERA